MRARLIRLSALLAVLTGCRVPAPQAPRPYAVTPPPPPPASSSPRWFGGEASASSAAEPVLVPFEAQNTRSPLGVNLGPLEPGRGEVVFTDRFRHAAPWRSVDWEGRPNQIPLDLDARGWVRRLARDQVAMTQVPTSPGARYVIRFAGDGRLDVERGRELRREGPGRFTVIASEESLVLRLEATSPASPLRDIRVLPEAWRDAPEVPRFDPAFLERVAPFAVLRFAAWARVGAAVPGRWSARARPEAAVQTGPKGVAWEHALDLAKQVQAEPWLNLPFAADDAYVEALAELVRQRLDPTRRVWIELGHEAWSPDTGRPGIRLMQRAAEARALDSDPTVARLLYQAERSREVFAIFERVLGTERLVRVMSAPVGAPATVRLLLGYGEVGAAVDAVAVAPRVGRELGTPERASIAERGPAAVLARAESAELPATVAALREVAKVTTRVGVDLVAYAGGLDLSPADDLRSPAARRALTAAAQDPGAAVLGLALLDAWRAAGGRTFVHSPLVGAGRPLPSPAAAGSAAPLYAALRRFAAHEPRWWKQPRIEVPPAEIADAERRAPAEADAPALAVAAPPPAPPKLYTAPWVKWVSLGVGVALGGLAAERFLAAEDQARLRDEALTGLTSVAEAERFDLLQAQIRQAEGDRELAQGLGFAAVGLSSALVGWAIAQWLEEPPEPELVVPAWSEQAREGDR